MSATNSTTHYELPSFLGSDKPAWLVDWNGAMATIDSAIYEAKQAADTAATSAGAVASDLATLSGTVSTQGTSISTLSSTLTTAVGNINTINSLIGNGTPTTTDQTIIGAINEINARTGEADGISYDNTDSGLTATNVQGAIDENATAIATLNSALSDSGWINYSTSSGNKIQYRKIGKTVEIRASGLSIELSTSYTDWILLPEGYRPSRDVYTRNIICGTDTHIAIGYVSATDGYFKLAATAAGTRLFALHLVYTVD